MQSHMMVPNPKKKYRINELDKKIVAFSPYYRVACNGKERKKKKERGVVIYYQRSSASFSSIFIH